MPEELNALHQRFRLHGFRKLTDLFAYRNEIAHEGAEANREKALEALTVVRTTLERIFEVLDGPSHYVPRGPILAEPSAPAGRTI